MTSTGKPCTYTARLLKGGALLEDMRMLVRDWSDAATTQSEGFIASNLLGKNTRARAADIYRRVFLPRYVNGNPPNAWRMVRALEDRDLPLETLRPVYYWITARSDRLLYDFVVSELLQRSRTHAQAVSTEDAIHWISSRLAKHGVSWSAEVTRRTARGILATLRDFGILEGAVRKRIAPVYLPIETFAYFAFLFHTAGASGRHLVQHPDWGLFLFTAAAVEHQLLEADRNNLLSYQAAGEIIRVDFPAHSYQEMADVIARRAHYRA
jgi:hypothetical protein